MGRRWQRTGRNPTGVLRGGPRHLLHPVISSGSGEYSLVVQFLASAAPPPQPAGDFDIEIREIGSVSQLLRTAVYHAARYWESAIHGDLESRTITEAAYGCPHVSLVGEVVDDLIIQVTEASIDGPGKAVAKGGWCMARDHGGRPGLPFVGRIEFDTADLATMSFHMIKAVVIHEIGHALGFGDAMWGPDRFDLLRLSSSGGPDSNIRIPGRDTHFVGLQAQTAFDQAVNQRGVPYAGNRVPVENDTDHYGAGGLDAHWRQSVFGDESMSTIIIPGDRSPVSMVTLASLADLGYEVNAAAAESYSLPVDYVPPYESKAIVLAHDIWRGPVGFVDRDGNVTWSTDQPQPRIDTHVRH